MSRFKVLGIIVAGVAVPVMLSIGAYLLSRAIGASASVAPVPAERVHRGNTDLGERQANPTPSATISPTARSDRCLEPEHINDPTCSTTGERSGSDSGGGTGDQSGSTSGSGSGGSSGSGGPGPSQTSSPSGSSGGSGSGGSDGSGGSGGGGGDDTSSHHGGDD